MTSAEDVVPNGAVLVENGRISLLHSEARHAALCYKKSGEPIEHVNGHGAWLMPGFVQTHIHLCQTLLRNGPDDLELLPWLRSHVWPGEAAHTEETLLTSARLGIAELLAGGTTCILDMGTIHHTGSVFMAAEEMGIRLTSGNALMDDPEVNPPYLLTSTQKALEEAEQLGARWHGGASGRLRVAFCPRFALSCTDGLLRELAARARSHGWLIHTHASENRSEIELVHARSGKANVEYLHDVGISGPRAVLAHVIHTDEKERTLLAWNGTGVAHCPSSNLKLASGVCPVPEYRKLGIRVSLGADGAPCNDRLDIFTEMRLAALLPKVRLGPGALGAYDVVRMATVEGARSLGLESECGTIEKGKKADFAILDHLQPFSHPKSWRPDPFGPIVYSFDRSHVVATYVEGELRYHREKLPVSRISPSTSQIENAVRVLEERKRQLVEEAS